MNHHANYGGSAVSMVEDKAAGRQREVPHELECLERNMKGIFQGLDHLESRLSESVLRAMPPAPPSTPSLPTAVVNTPLGNRLQEANSVLAGINERIQSFIARLEA